MMLYVGITRRTEREKKMTINDAKVNLFKFFNENEVLNLDSDFNQVVTVSMDPEIDKEIVALALKEFETQNLASKLNLPDKNVWVLNKPLKQYSQTIELHYPTLEILTKLINDYCEEVGDHENTVDPLQILEKDIQSVLILLNNLKNVENGA